MKVVGLAPCLISLRVTIFAGLATPFRLLLLASLLLVPALSLAQIFVQENNNSTATNASSVTVTYANAETVGDLNVVVVGWSDTTSSVIRSSTTTRTFMYWQAQMQGMVCRKRFTTPQTCAPH